MYGKNVLRPWIPLRLRDPCFGLAALERLENILILQGRDWLVWISILAVWDGLSGF
jgi:hypothetical protein